MGIFLLLVLFSQYRSCGDTEEVWTFVVFIKKIACKHENVELWKKILSWVSLHDLFWEKKSTSKKGQFFSLLLGRAMAGIIKLSIFSQWFKLKPETFQTHKYFAYYISTAVLTKDIKPIIVVDVTETTGEAMEMWHTNCYVCLPSKSSQHNYQESHFIEEKTRSIAKCFFAVVYCDICIKTSWKEVFVLITFIFHNVNS